MAATPSIRIEITSPYKGGTKVWSNRYHFNGGTPADLSHWTTLANNVIAQQKTCMNGVHTITGWLGYAAGSDVPVASATVSVAGTGSFANGVRAPLEVCALARFSTTARTVKNHPVYLFSYLHGAQGDSTSSDYELLNPAQKTAIDAFSTAWIAGFSDGTNTLVRAGPNGATGVSRTTDLYLTHRDFPT